MNIKKKSMKEKNNINRKLSWLKLVSEFKCVHIWLKKALAILVGMAIWEGLLFAGWVLSSGDFQQAIKQIDN